LAIKLDIDAGNCDRAAVLLEMARAAALKPQAAPSTPIPIVKTGGETVPTSTAIVVDRKENQTSNAPLGDPTAREVLASPGPDEPTGVDVVEASLAQALRAAATAGRFDIVAQLAKELEARRLHRRCAQAGRRGAGA
jgi:hypothetical protein